MGVLSDFLDHQTTKWIEKKIPELQKSSKFRAHNSIRFLIWADKIFETSPIVAAFCAMHATEEAVACFIEAAKKHGFKEHAKSINLHDHKSKALVSILTQRLSITAEQMNLGFALHIDRDCLACRFPVSEGYEYRDLHLSLFEFPGSQAIEETPHLNLGEMPTTIDIQAEIEKLAAARNGLLYATSNGFPTGWINPDISLFRDAKLSLGLIWASIDVSQKSKENAPILDYLLSQMASYEVGRAPKTT